MNSWRAILPLGLRVSLRRFQRRLWNAAHREATARARISRPEAFPHVVARHESRLIRSVPQEMRPLQHSKIRNLELGCARMDRLLIERGEVFSFCALIGRTSYRRGFVDGLEMHAGRLVGAPGGGLCQLANLIFWMGLHLDLDILERHRHELDLFPDDGRSVPFGMGASVFYNYRDLRLRNHLSQPLVLRVGVRPPRLWGTVLSDRPLPFRVEIIERSHRFFRGSEGKVWRENRVFRRVEYRDGRPAVESEIAHNLGRVCYPIEENRIEDVSSTEALRFPATPPGAVPDTG